MSTTEFKPCNLRMEHCLNMIASLPSSSLVECQDQVDIGLWKSPCPLDGWPQQIITGTTLMRAMLDAHHDVRCGEETRVVPRLLQVYLSQPTRGLHITVLFKIVKHESRVATWNFVADAESLDEKSERELEIGRGRPHWGCAWLCHLLFYSGGTNNLFTMDCILSSI